MFSNIFQKATLLGITALTSIAMTGSFMANSAQAATLDILNSEAVTENSSSIQLPTEGTKMAAFIRRASIKKKPTKNYRVAPKPTNNNKPVNERTNNNQLVPVTKPAPEKTNNNKPVSATEGTKMAAFIRRASIRKKPTSNYRVAPKPTNNNKPASVTKPANERTNNNEPVPANNSASDKK
ncbi:MAG: hypothetical protein WBF90_37565 [Rivularia sp. (in: cyanobacteria)]|jgi:hypothetical protein